MKHLAIALIALVPLASPVTAQPKGCPPGLAKKDPPCVPPGLAKNRHGIGDVIRRDYVIIDDYGRYGLDPDQTYYRVGDYVYRVDRETGEVLDLIGALSALLN